MNSIIKSGYTIVEKRQEAIAISIKPAYAKVSLVLFSLFLLAVVFINTSIGISLYIQLLFISVLAAYIVLKLINSFLMYPIIFNNERVMFKRHIFGLKKYNIEYSKIDKVNIEFIEGDKKFSALNIFINNKRFQLIVFRPEVTQEELKLLALELKNLGVPLTCHPHWS